MRHRTIRVIESANFPYVHNGEEKGEWRAKLRIAGDFTSSQMQEASGKEDMREVLQIYLPKLAPDDLELTADVKTLRKTYLVQRPFGWHSQANAEAEIRIVLHEVNAGDEQDGNVFKHVIGEVELTSEVVGGESNQEHQHLRNVEVARMQARLDEFVRRHTILFPSEGVKGKLQAFFEWSWRQRYLTSLGRRPDGVSEEGSSNRPSRAKSRNQWYPLTTCLC